MNPRTEPLLWTQLLGLAVLPLETLLILLTLAGSDPGPVPVIEEVLCWTLGGLAPALLLWRTPADVWSLLAAQIPARGRRDLQQRLSRLQDTLPLRLLGPGLGSLALLPLLIRLDQLAAVASPLWHPNHLPRLVALLLAALVLSVMVWQWQQLLQALWLLGRSEDVIRATSPMSAEELVEHRLSVGLPLLLPAPLKFEGTTRDGAPAGSSGPADESSTVIHGAPSPIDPEQSAAEDQSPQLDEPIEIGRAHV